MNRRRLISQGLSTGRILRLRFTEPFYPNDIIAAGLGRQQFLVMKIEGEDHLVEPFSKVGYNGPADLSDVYPDIEFIRIGSAKSDYDTEGITSTTETKKKVKKENKIKVQETKEGFKTIYKIK